MQLESIIYLAGITTVVIACILIIAIYFYYKQRQRNGSVSPVKETERLQASLSNTLAQDNAQPVITTPHTEVKTAPSTATVASTLTETPPTLLSQQTVRFIPPAVSVLAAAPHASRRVVLPEDSVLRRHVLTQLRSEIEAELPPRPTDSVLKRHYEQLIATRLAQRIIVD